MKIIGETFFLDANVLISATDRSRQHHQRALKLLSLIPQSGGHLAWSGQVLREYLVVATRPIEVNGLGLSLTSALENVGELQQRLRLLAEDSTVATNLATLVARYGVFGKRIHDANLVATMLAHRIAVCVTDNTQDYLEFAEVEVVDSGLRDRAT